MTLNEIIKKLQQLASKIPNVNAVVSSGNQFDLNAEEFEQKYAAVCISQRQHNPGKDFNTFNFTIYYVDRLTNDRSNVTEIQSTAIESLTSLIRAIDSQNWLVDSVYGDIQTFNERFTAECAGAYFDVGIVTVADQCALENFDVNIDLSQYYTKAEADEIFATIEQIAEIYNSVYTKEEVDALLSDIDVETGFEYNPEDGSVKQKTTNFSKATGQQAAVLGRGGIANGQSAVSLSGAGLAHYIWIDDDFDGYYISPVLPTTAETSITADQALFGKGAAQYIGLPIIDRNSFEELTTIKTATYNVEKPWILKVTVEDGTKIRATKTPAQNIIWPYGIAKGACTLAKMGVAAGTYTTSLGRRSLIVGNNSADLGAANEAHTTDAINIGYGNTNNGPTSQIVGTSNVNLGQNSVVLGFNSINEGTQSLVMGNGNKLGLAISGTKGTKIYDCYLIDNAGNKSALNTINTNTDDSTQWYKRFFEYYIVGSKGVGFYDHNITPSVTNVDIENNTITFEKTLNPNEDIVDKWIIFGSAQGAGSHSTAIEGYTKGYNSIGINKGIALGKFSAAIGEGTVATNDHEFVIGKWNETYSDTVFSIGDGTMDKPHSVMTVDQEGRVWLGTNDFNNISFDPEYNSTFLTGEGIFINSPNDSSIVVYNGVKIKTDDKKLTYNGVEVATVDDIPDTTQIESRITNIESQLDGLNEILTQINGE